MKKALLFLPILIGLFACHKNHIDPINLVGKWKLTEYYADPGDGSGKFEPTSRSKTITFTSNGQIKCSAGLCDYVSATPETGSYNTTNKTITGTNCNGWSYNYELKNNALYIYYNCIEGCGEKFVKEK